MKNAFIARLFENMTAEKLFIFSLIIVLLVVIFLYVKDKSLNDIREDVYDLFLKAEHLYTETGAGEDRLDWVVDLAYPKLPWYIQLFINKDVLKKIIDKWFRGIKDLLDDGKLNDSTIAENDTPVTDVECTE